MSFFEEFKWKYNVTHGHFPDVRADGVTVMLCNEIDRLRAAMAGLHIDTENLIRRIEALEAKPKPPSGCNDEVES